jgi:hypothetical protein
MGNVRFLVMMAYFIEIVVGGVIILIGPGGIHIIGPDPGPEGHSVLFLLVGVGFVIGGLARLASVALNPQPLPPVAVGTVR